MQCFIVRDKGASKMYPHYSLYLDVGHKFLLAARKRKKSKASTYVLSLDPKVGPDRQIYTQYLVRALKPVSSVSVIYLVV